MNFELGYQWLGFILVCGLTLIAVLLMLLVIVSFIYGIFIPREVNKMIKDNVDTVKHIAKNMINEEGSYND